MTDPTVLKEFTERVTILAAGSGVEIPDLIRALQQNSIVKQVGILPVIRRVAQSEANETLRSRKGPATFEDFYLYVNSLNSSTAIHELTELKHRDSREYPKHFFTITEDHLVVGLARQDRAGETPATYAVFTFEPDIKMVILSRVVNGVPEQIATPYRVSFDTLIGGNTTSWQYVFNYQGSEVKETLSTLLNM
ncbi:MAG: hypothetical protein NC548_13095 [Lachnospiraceae bacterium]|nr:hypothetical protein [Lachnospiraceae bacterium]MCM1230674.1 hypothetical protein [Ruminococcus flavefaciens]